MNLWHAEIYLISFYGRIFDSKGIWCIRFCKCDRTNQKLKKLGSGIKCHVVVLNNSEFRHIPSGNRFKNTFASNLSDLCPWSQI